MNAAEAYTADLEAAARHRLWAQRHRHGYSLRTCEECGAAAVKGDPCDECDAEEVSP